MKFAISVLCLNRLSATERCLNALAANSGGHDVELMVTDNASADGTREFLAGLGGRLPGNVRLRVFQERENTGFIPPNNRAFALAVREGADYFVALNNDTVPPAGWLEELAAPLEEDERGILCGPMGTCCALLDSFHGVEADDRYEYVEGSCLCARVDRMMAFNRQTGREEDAFFADYLQFIYGDDSDLSLRVREAGWRIFRAPFHMPHTRGETVLMQPEVMERCGRAQDANHGVLTRRWRHYIRHRRFDHAIVIRRKYALGDVILTTPIVRAVRESFPCAVVMVETDSPEVFHGNPNVDHAAREIGREDGQVWVNLDMAYEDRPRLSILDAYSVVAHAGLPGLRVIEPRTELFPSAGLVARTIAGLPHDKLCVMHAGPTDWPGKNWPIERFAEVAAWMMRDGWTVRSVGVVNPQIPGVRHLPTAGIMELAAVMAGARLFVGIDSGPLHVAQAMGCRVVGVFGVTFPERIVTEGSEVVACAADRDVPCAGARHREPGKTFVDCDPACILSVTAESVMAAVGGEAGAGRRLTRGKRKPARGKGAVA